PPSPSHPFFVIQCVVFPHLVSVCRPRGDHQVPLGSCDASCWLCCVSLSSESCFSVTKLYLTGSLATQTF
ncbi:hypothetical protein V3C99_017446, partial [Haemonchus contortus]|uniref:Secreted protein n=1 Tax=Haemonchus contortus TaxID=6289 RepID=A0A7I4Z7M1_HAECO